MEGVTLILECLLSSTITVQDYPSIQKINSTTYTDDQICYENNLDCGFSSGYTFWVNQSNLIITNSDITNLFLY